MGLSIPSPSLFPIMYEKIYETYKNKRQEAQRENDLYRLMRKKISKKNVI
jgi:hypothetical protein